MTEAISPYSRVPSALNLTSFASLLEPLVCAFHVLCETLHRFSRRQVGVHRILLQLGKPIRRPSESGSPLVRRTVNSMTLSGGMRVNEISWVGIRESAESSQGPRWSTCIRSIEAWTAVEEGGMNGISLLSPHAMMLTSFRFGAVHTPQDVTCKIPHMCATALVKCETLERTGLPARPGCRVCKELS
jgi:hypothetical protein